MGGGGFGGGRGGGRDEGRGGGGLGAGGGIFVQQGGSLTLAGPLTVNGNTVTVGSGTSGGFNGSAFGSGLFLQGDGTLTFAPGAGQTQTVADAIVDQTGSGGTGDDAGSYSLIKQGAGMLVLSGNNAYSGGTTIQAGTLQVGSSGTSGTLGSGAVTNDARLVFNRSDAFEVANAVSGSGSFTKQGGGTLTLTGANAYTGGTFLDGGTVSVSQDVNLGGAAGGLAFNGGALQTTASFSTARAITLGAAGGTFRPDAATMLTVSSPIGGSGGLVMDGLGTLVLAGANTYSGGTTVNGGLLSLGPDGSLASTGALTVNGGTFDLNGHAQTVGALSGSGGTIALGNGQLTTNSASGSTTLASTITGTGGLTKTGAGTLTLTAINTYTGGTILNAGGLAVSGSLASGVTVNDGNLLVIGSVAGGVVQNAGSTLLTGTVGGSFTMNAGTAVLNGTVTGTVTANGGTLGGSGSMGGLVASGTTLMPGNSIGTLTVNGNFSQSGGVYQVEANAAGQADRINATGTAAINGGTVQVLAQPGNYATSTTYTILTATGGVSGAYSGVSSDFAFLTPSLSYDTNNVFLTLALQGNAFSGFGGNTPNQRAVGYALDQTYANASGDFATVIGALANLSTTQASLALDAISGQPYADFGTTNVNTSAMFMNTLGQQMALARSGAGSGQRVALAQACVVEACDTARPLSAWFSGLGGLGSGQGDANASTLTYNFGGAAAGIDYRLSPQFLVGLGVGYTHGTQWVNSFQGQGWSDSVSVAAYGSFTPSGSLAGFYADALAGYAYFNNQLQRQIQIPGLQPRTANGSTGANQFLTQAETGYALPVFGEKLTATPFARLQFSTTTQNGFSESGADSLSLNVAQQTTNSLRTVFGAELASNLPLSAERSLGLALRLGWQHEHADTARPITTAFSGAPTASFTVYGATPTRDAAVVGFSADTTIAEATQLYARYDGTLASGTDNHAFNLGVRFSW